ncbi:MULTISPECIES: LCP family protein [unclassified Paenarthrobacter]|uniref:LCP family glycopolymer transferase n=1 Tax=unclassified Paenarthrobacter TaxID=2634190 RepID=UPI000AF9C133|nr:LCP family protein [Paenarthrobacter sp. R1]WIV29193.1 LCP family protein [Paenarthrobacter sp. R1]
MKRVQEGKEKALQGGLLTVRARGAQGVGRKLAQKRLRLRATLDSTTRAVELFRDQQRPVEEIPAIMDTLTRSGSALDSQLRLAEREPDENSRRAAAFEPHLARIERAARDVRSTLTDAAIALGTDDLENDVAARLATESQVLQAWIQSYSSSGHFPAEPLARITSQSTRTATVVCKRQGGSCGYMTSRSAAVSAIRCGEAMKISKRMAVLLRSGTTGTPDQAGKPCETLETLFARQQDTFRQLRRGLAGIAAARTRVDLRAQRASALMHQLQKEARQAIAAGQETMAREALGRRAVLHRSLTDLGRQDEALRDQEDALARSLQTLQSQVDGIRVRKEYLDATRRAADARTVAARSLSGFGGDLAEIDHFLMADFNAVKELSNAVGGVEVCVSSAVFDPDSGLRLPEGTSQVQGDQALAFLRTRHAFADGGDLGRIKAQQAFLGSLTRKLKAEGTLGDPQKMLGIADTVTKNLTVDEGLASAPALLTIADRLKNLDPAKVNFITVPNAPAASDPNRLALSEPAAGAFFAALKQNPDLSQAAAAPAPSSAPPQEPAETGYNKALQPITVANGTAVAGRSQEIAALLSANGFTNLARIPAQPRAETMVYYGPGFADVAADLAAMFALPASNVQELATVRGVQIYAGEDFAAGNRPLVPAPGPDDVVAQTANDQSCQSANPLG